MKFFTIPFGLVVLIILLAVSEKAENLEIVGGDILPLQVVEVKKNQQLWIPKHNVYVLLLFSTEATKWDTMLDDIEQNSDVQITTISMDETFLEKCSTATKNNPVYILLHDPDPSDGNALAEYGFFEKTENIFYKASMGVIP
jgi:hypothetical protein